MQRLESKIFRREIHLPSGVKEWQHPAGAALPMPPPFFLPLPEEEQETSYFADSVRIFSFSSEIMPSL